MKNSLKTSIHVCLPILKRKFSTSYRLRKTNLHLLQPTEKELVFPDIIENQMDNESILQGKMEKEYNFNPNQNMLSHVPKMPGIT